MKKAIMIKNSITNCTILLENLLGLSYTGKTLNKTTMTEIENESKRNGIIVLSCHDKVGEILGHVFGMYKG
jgi:hypothetical protein